MLSGCEHRKWSSRDATTAPRLLVKMILLGRLYYIILEFYPTGNFPVHVIQTNKRLYVCVCVCV